MVNASLNWASIVGVALVIAGFIPFFKKSISTQYDPFLVPIFWLCGLILFFQGWRLDPILQFGQFLLAGVVFFVGYENIKLRELIKKLKNQSYEESKFNKEDEYIKFLFCPKCRAPIKDKDLFCGECGYKLEEINEQKVKKETTKRKQKRSLKSFDYISALGLTEDFDESQLKKAYRREARKWHPDLNKNDKNAEAQFMLINEAYEFLNKQLEREEDKKNY
jgi:uncharacterized Zn finger protein (UPF0148 family)